MADIINVVMWTLPVVRCKNNQEILSSEESGEDLQEHLKHVLNHVFVCHDFFVMIFLFQLSFWLLDWSFLRPRISLSSLRFSTCLKLGRDCGALVLQGQDSCTIGQWRQCARAVLWHCTRAEVWHCQCGSPSTVRILTLLESVGFY